MQSFFFATVRLFQIAWAVAGFFVVPLFRRGKSAVPAPVRMRQALEYLGGAWVKLGQTLALRFDLLPPEYCTEFLKLLNDAKPFSYAKVREIVRDELGRYPEEIFASFEIVPIASASIAQVHKAIALDGRRVAVKVQRPSVRRQFTADFWIMRALSYTVDLFDASKGRTSRAFIDEIEQWTNEEIDFRKEARNGHRMWLFSKDDPAHVDAKIVFEYSTSRILTTEFMDGIPLIDIIKAVHNSDDRYLDDLARRGYDRAKIARRICWNLFNQLFRDQFFHADLHPGNIFVLPGNVIGYIDFGISSQLSPELKTSLQNYVRYLVDGNIDKAVSELIRWVTPAPTTNLDQFRQDFAALLEEYRFGTSNSSNSLKLTSELIVRNMSLMRQHRLVASRGLSLYFKAVLTADSVVFEVEPGYKLFNEIKVFFTTAQRDDIRDMLSGIRIPQLLVNSTYQVNQLVAAVSRTQSTGRSFEVWIETLQTRLAMYGFLAITLAIISYAVYHSELVNSGSRLFGVTLSSVLLFGVVVLLIVMWRRGRELTTVDRRPMERGAQDGPS